MSRGATKEITCACGCKRIKIVRIADINRGWGMFFSKSCKAIHQYKMIVYYRSKGYYNLDIERGWKEHK